MRTLVDIPDDLIEELDALAREHKSSRAAEVRDAVRKHLADQNDRSWIDAGFGYWKDRDDIPDGVEYQRAMREDQTLD